MQTDASAATEIKRRSVNAYPLPDVARAFGLRPAWLRKHVRAGTLRRELRGGPGAKRQTYYLRPLDVDQLLNAGTRAVPDERESTGRRGRSPATKVPQRY